MKRSILVVMAVLVGAMIAVSPIPAQAVDLTIDDIIYQPSTGLDPLALSATATATISGNTLTIVLTNTSASTGGTSASWLLTGIGFELPSGVTLTNTGAYITSGSSGWYKDGPTVHTLSAGANLRGEWGGGASEGPFVDITTFSTDYVAATLKSAFASGDAFDPSAYLSNPVHTNGPEFGLLSQNFSNAGGLGYVQDSLTLTWTFTGTLTEAFLEAGNVVVSFGSPTASVPEPSTLLLLGSGLLFLGGLGRSRIRK